jgi:beta-galactosidase/beta-glucuronidase
LRKKVNKYRLISIFILLVCSVSEASVDDQKIFLRKNWLLQSSYMVKEDANKVSSVEFQPQDWYPTKVPTTILRALVQNNVYPDPYIGLNNMRIPDASDEFNKTYDLGKYSHLPDKRNPWKDPYWFWTQFNIPDHFEGKIIWLDLEGINYRAEVWLNRNLVANSKDVVGMFGNWSFNITDYVNFVGKNTLAIKIFPLDYPGLPAEPQLRAFGPFGLNGGPTGDIGKNVTMHCSVGWDWIPAVRDRNMGIWQDVYITATGAVDIKSPRIVSDLALPELNQAALTIEAELVNLSSSRKNGILKAKISPKNFKGGVVEMEERILLESNQTKMIRFDSQSHRALMIENPGLWWPNGYGGANLYELELAAEVDGKRSDSEQQTFGVRQVDSRVTMVEGWARRDFFVNGQKIFLKGGAWVPDMMLNRSKEKLYQELRLSKEANLNIFRIWGGGLTPPESFFSFCDEMGLLVWHDFWITGDCQGTWDKGSQDYPYEADVFLENATDVVKKLRNHPSIFVWTAGNEGYPREEIYVPLRREILAKLDGTRPFIPSSGYREPPEGWGLSWPDNQKAGTYSGGPYHWVDPREYYKKVCGGKDWLFKNEVGLPSVPCLESIKKFISDLTIDPEVKFPLNHTWGYHDACEGNGKYSLYDQAIRQRYGEPKDLEDYVQKAQLINAENYRAIFEAVSQAMDRIAGVILWKTNPAWPSMIWQLYDWYLCPNAGYYYTKKACEPLHVQLNLDDLSVVGINHYLETKDLIFIGDVYSWNMEKVWALKDRIRLGATSAAEFVKVKIPEKVKKNIYFVDLRLEDSQGDLISENFYWMAGDDDFTSLAKLPEVKLDVEVEKVEIENRCVYKIHLKNTTENLAFFVRPSIRKAETGDEVLPCFWSDNYFSILPQRYKELTVEFQKQEFMNDKLVLKMDGWNIVSRTIQIE